MKNGGNCTIEIIGNNSFQLQPGFGLLGLNASATAGVISRFGLLGLNGSATARVISEFGLLELNASATVRVISRFGLLGLITPQQQPGSYRGLVC